MEPNNQFANFRGAAAPFDWERLLHGGKSAAVSRSGVDADGWANTDNYMEDVLLGRQQFDSVAESDAFTKTMKLAREKLGETAFLRYRGETPTGALPPAYFEAIAIGLHANFDQIKTKARDALRTSITNLVQSEEFRAVTGPGANSKEKLKARIQLVGNALIAAQ